MAVGDGLWKTASEAPTNFKIYDIEAMGISLPYKSKNGWSEFWR